MRNTNMNQTKTEFKPRIKKRFVNTFVALILSVVLALTISRVPIQAQWSCSSIPPEAPRGIIPYCNIAQLAGNLLPWDKLIESLKKDPWDLLLCWGIKGHSGAIDFNQSDVDRYRKKLYMQEGDSWQVHAHCWPQLRCTPCTNNADIEILDPKGSDILQGRGHNVGSHQYLWGQAPATGEYTIMFTPHYFVYWSCQGEWSLYWEIEFPRMAFCKATGCGPGWKYPCPQAVELLLTAQVAGEGVRLEWTSGSTFDLYEIEGAPGTAFGGPTTEFFPLAIEEGSEAMHQVGPLSGGEYHFLIWGHRREGVPVISNAVTVALSRLGVKATCDNARIRVTPPGTTVTGPKFGSFAYARGATVELEALDEQIDSCGMLPVQSVFRQWEAQVGTTKTTFTTPKIQITLNQDTTVTAIYEPVQVAKVKLDVKAVAQIWLGPIKLDFEINVPVLVNGSPMTTPVSLQLDKGKPVTLIAQQQVTAIIPGIGPQTLYFRQWECQPEGEPMQVFRNPTISFTLTKDTVCTVVYAEE